MLRMRSEDGWWLITHPDHARLAGAFAEAWGNEVFHKPEPRGRVLDGIACHDDGWAERDAHPKITREGKPSAFSTELVGKYSAFEEIDLADYLAVRERAVRMVAERDPYAGLLIAKHTYNLLTARADRTTIACSQLPLLDEFLEAQREYQAGMLRVLEEDLSLTPLQKQAKTIEEHFCLLQACDNLSLLACVAFEGEADLLHPLPTKGGGAVEIRVKPMAPRVFRLDPWPFARGEVSFYLPGRHVMGSTFESSAKLEEAFHASPVEMLAVKLLA